MTELLPLFVQICDAVQAAHVRGIIHRDLKPSNIRVDEHGTPHVLDFGLAKLTVPVSAGGPGADAAIMTRTGQFIGSLAWASPEQAEGAHALIDLRTDVYSLGVVLYHALTGVYPYDVTGTTREVVERIVGVAPTRPRTVCRAIDDELETILLRSLAKDRERRYQTAGELAGDLRRYLAGEPISAKRDSLGYVLRKHAKRHRLEVGFVALLLVVLISGLVVSLAFWQQALTAQHGLKQTLKRAEQREQDLREIAAAQSKMLSDIEQHTMGARLREDVLAEARAALERATPDPELLAGRVAELEALLAATNFTNAGVRSIDRNLLAPALASIERDLAAYPLVQAALWQTISRVYSRLGLYEAALPPAERSWETRRRVLGDDHPDTLGSTHEVGKALMLAGNWPAAEEHLREALARRRRVLGEDHPDTLHSIAALAEVSLRLGRIKVGEDYTHEVLERRRRILGKEHPDTLSSMDQMGQILLYRQRIPEAEALLAQTLATRRRVLGYDHPDTLESVSALAGLLSNQGRLAEAEEYNQDALQGRMRTEGDLHPATLVSWGNLGLLRVQQGRLAEAELCFRKSLDGFRRTQGDTYPSTIRQLQRLGDTLGRAGKLEEAEHCLRQAVEKWRRAAGDDHVDTLRAHSTVCGFLLRQGRGLEAEPYCRAALDGWLVRLGADNSGTLGVTKNLGLALIMQGRYDEAESLLMLAMTAADNALPNEDSVRGRLMDSLVQLYEARQGAEPERGHDLSACEWREKLEAWRASTQPAAAAPAR